MPRCFMNSVRWHNRGADNEEIAYASGQNQQIKNNELKPDWFFEQTKDDTHTENDWRSLENLPFVTRWALNKIPPKVFGKKKIKPKYDSPPLSEESGDENPPTSIEKSSNFALEDTVPNQADAALIEPSELNSLLVALNELNQQASTDQSSSISTGSGSNGLSGTGGYKSDGVVAAVEGDGITATGASPQLISYYTCLICLNTLSHKGQLPEHTSEQSFICPECYKALDKRWTTGVEGDKCSSEEWKWHCQLCGQAFSQRKYMVRHCLTACVKYAMSTKMARNKLCLS